jgi:putative ABC transport system substrate-binding protein
VQFFFAWLIAILLAMTYSIDANSAAKPYRIGFVGATPSTAASDLKPFRDRLRELGYVEGQDFKLEQRYWEGKVERLPALIGELVALKSDVIVTSGTEAGFAARNTTKTIPIVLGFGVDVLRLGFVTELAHPNGNITGMTSIGPDLYGKKLELLKESIPRLSKIGFIWSSSNPGNTDAQTRDVEKMAGALGLSIQSYDVREPEKFDFVFRSAKQYGAQAILLGAGGLFGFHQKRIIDLTVKHRLPAMHSNVQHVEAGGLMAYMYDRPYQFRRAAEYVDKILKGAKPSDLPIERPNKFELVINLKTARQIGLPIPPNVLARADRVIR